MIECVVPTPHAHIEAEWPAANSCFTPACFSGFYLPTGFSARPGSVQQVTILSMKSSAAFHALFGWFRRLAGIPMVSIFSGLIYFCFIFLFTVFAECWKHRLSVVAMRTADCVDHHSVFPRCQAQPSQCLIHGGGEKPDGDSLRFVWFSICVFDICAPWAAVMGLFVTRALSTRSLTLSHI